MTEGWDGGSSQEAEQYAKDDRESASSSPSPDYERIAVEMLTACIRTDKDVVIEVGKVYENRRMWHDVKAAIPILEKHFESASHSEPRRDERERFEHWCCETMLCNPGNLDRLTGGKGPYRLHNVQCWWMGWLAARASAAPLSQRATIADATCPRCGWYLTTADERQYISKQCADTSEDRNCPCGGERGKPSCQFPDASQPQPSAGQPIKKSWVRSCTEHKDGYHNNCDACFSDMGVEIMTLRVAEPSAGQTEGNVNGDRETSQGILPRV